MHVNFLRLSNDMIFKINTQIEIAYTVTRLSEDTVKNCHFIQTTKFLPKNGN